MHRTLVRHHLVCSLIVVVHWERLQWLLEVVVIVHSSIVYRGCITDIVGLSIRMAIEHGLLGEGLLLLLLPGHPCLLGRQLLGREVIVWAIVLLAERLIVLGVLLLCLLLVRQEESRSLGPPLLYTGCSPAIVLVVILLILAVLLWVRMLRILLILVRRC